MKHQIDELTELYELVYKRMMSHDWSSGHPVGQKCYRNAADDPGRGCLDNQSHPIGDLSGNLTFEHFEL